jgi:hypothetical protein
MKAITCLNLSKWLSILAAAFKYLGPKDQMSTILYIADLGSNILIGIDM